MHRDHKAQTSSAPDVGPLVSPCHGATPQQSVLTNRSSVQKVSVCLNMLEHEELLQTATTDEGFSSDPRLVDCICDAFVDHIKPFNRPPTLKIAVRLELSRFVKTEAILCEKTWLVKRRDSN